MIGKKRGRYIEAEKYYSLSLHIIEKVYGNKHPKVALFVHNLGTTLLLCCSTMCGGAIRCCDSFVALTALH
jgi:hypothetical protein